MLYVGLIVCCFRAQSVSYRFDKLQQSNHSETLITFSDMSVTRFFLNFEKRFSNTGERI